jgi:catechol 2,3-dioxygenase-like lactoylglutathione lyase family enzyme
MDYNWTLPVAQVRIACPTDKLQEITRFYCEDLGLHKIGAFEKHNGYDGIMVGLLGYSYHLEFTQHEAGSPCPASTKDNLLMLYIPELSIIKAIVKRLSEMGYPEAEPENPYWHEKGAVTIVDPDGWRLALMPTTGIGPT